ncbi:MAG: DUF2281 domain-containing protein [Bacteroidetes Order II. Incertae sedis bacterium]|nr:DUF2281 domain-containing protein [Bacteroidetes Order II. bacterium]
MTTDATLFAKIHTLPPELKADVLKYIDFLLFTQNQENEKPKMEAQKTPKAGFGRVQYVMSDDFDAPLEDFAEYM